MHSVLIVAVVALTTIFIRFLPFLFQSGTVSGHADYLGKTLPPCAMALLTVFCLRDIRFDRVENFAPEIIAAMIAAFLYRWKHSTALAIVASTALYMWMVQKLF